MGRPGVALWALGLVREEGVRDAVALFEQAFAGRAHPLLCASSVIDAN